MTQYFIVPLIVFKNEFYLLAVVYYYYISSTKLIFEIIC